MVQIAPWSDESGQRLSGGLSECSTQPIVHIPLGEITRLMPSELILAYENREMFF
jgi:hypothetical protein